MEEGPLIILNPHSVSEDHDRIRETGKRQYQLVETDKSDWGALYYFKSGIAALPELESFRVDIFSENENLGVGVLNVVVDNGRYAASGIPVASQARLTDGKLDAALYMAMDYRTKY